MTWRHLYGKSNPNPVNPETTGVCNRCGFLFELSKLKYQLRRAGTSIIKTNLRVCSKCRDDIENFTAPVVLPPDPLPVTDANPQGAYDIDE